MTRPRPQAPGAKPPYPSWLIRKVEAVPFDSSSASIVGPATNTVEVVELSRLRVAEEELERLRRASSYALMDALSWLDPAIARRFKEDTPYQQFRAALSGGVGGGADDD